MSSDFCYSLENWIIYIGYLQDTNLKIYFYIYLEMLIGKCLFSYFFITWIFSLDFWDVPGVWEFWENELSSSSTCVAWNSMILYIYQVIYYFFYNHVKLLTTTTTTHNTNWNWKMEGFQFLTLHLLHTQKPSNIFQKIKSLWLIFFMSYW